MAPPLHAETDLAHTDARTPQQADVLAPTSITDMYTAQAKCSIPICHSLSDHYYAAMQ